MCSAASTSSASKAWHTANDAVLAEGRRVLIDDEHRFDGVTAIGVDESKQAFKTWLAERPQAWRDRMEVVAMDGFTGFKTATVEELPDPVAVMDPFHVVRLAGDALDRCRRRVQQAIHGHRGRKDAPLYRARRALHTGAGLLTDRQQTRLDALFAVDEHAEVEVTWWIYQRMIAAYREPDSSRGRELMVTLIDSISHGVPSTLSEVVTLGRTLKLDRTTPSQHTLCEELPGVQAAEEPRLSERAHRGSTRRRSHTGRSRRRRSR